MTKIIRIHAEIDDNLDVIFINNEELSQKKDSKFAQNWKMSVPINEEENSQLRLSWKNINKIR